MMMMIKRSVRWTWEVQSGDLFADLHPLHGCGGVKYVRVPVAAGAPWLLLIRSTGCLR